MGQYRRIRSDPRSHLRLLFGLLAGSVLGLSCNALASGAPWLTALIKYVTEPLGSIFIRSLLVLVLPLVFSAMAVGIGELDLKHLGRLGSRTLGYTVLLSSLAVLIGLTLVNVLEPGAEVSDEVLRHARETVAAAP